MMMIPRRRTRRHQCRHDEPRLPRQEQDEPITHSPFLHCFTENFILNISSLEHSEWMLLVGFAETDQMANEGGPRFTTKEWKNIIIRRDQKQSDVCRKPTTKDHRQCERKKDITLLENNRGQQEHHDRGRGEEGGGESYVAKKLSI